MIIVSLWQFELVGGSLLGHSGVAIILFLEYLHCPSNELFLASIHLISRNLISILHYVIPEYECGLQSGNLSLLEQKSPPYGGRTTIS